MTTETETFETIRYTADVIVMTPDNRVLLIERGWDPHKGAWALPGGHVDPGETSREAATRELLEEAGVQINPAHLRQIGVFDEPDRDPRGRYITAAYLAIVPNDTVATAGDDAVRAAWFDINQLPGLAFDHATIIDAALTTNNV
ncbi:NUDIX hydrolase [Streptomyces sp. ISL-112]|uniref:NUDIX domain-containing protein n=1 Tax=unclassified Streptomyces TaxID=2593676 RepID=UPI001BE7E7BF|nr:MULTISPECIES: NUDIX hydrolase [unclassified Streptomyces]MBT2425243.1 NUDIX hydrolase [Streptomyces sp. ISL-112]MBT2462034.1 NUDIX hydrolase [Streptomyces sp. ISL-63]